MDIITTLNKLEADLAGLLNEVPTAEVREFATKAEFLQYAKEQISLAKSEEPADQKARLTHLFANVEIVKNGFEDSSTMSIPVFSGPLSVQAQTAWKERSQNNTSVQAAIATQAPGPKGFAQKNNSLTIEQLMVAFGELLASKDGDVTTKSEDPKEGEAPETDPDPAVIATPDEAEADTLSGPAADSPADEAVEKSDPWGGVDMNDTVFTDADEYQSGLRGF